MQSSAAKKDGEPASVTLERSHKLSQQVVVLEAENVELQDINRSLEKANKEGQHRIQQLELECQKLRDSTVFIHQEKEGTVLQAREAVQSKQAELMIAQKKVSDAEKRLETFASENRRLNSIAEKLQAERSQLQHQILGFEASTKALHVELQQRAAAEGKSVNTCKDFSQRLEAMRLQNTQLADLAGLHHLEMAQLTQTREELRSWRQRSEDLAAELEQVRQNGAWLRDRLSASDAANGQLKAEAERWRHAEKAAAANGPRLAEAVQRESAVAQSLRERVAELEDQVIKSQRAQMALEAEREILRSQLVAAQSEAKLHADAASRLAGEKSQAEQLAKLHLAQKQEAERRRGILENDHLPKLIARQQAATSDVGELRTRISQLEAEKSLLMGQLSGSEVLVAGLRTECANANARLMQQRQHYEDPRRGVPPRETGGKLDSSTTTAPRTILALTCLAQTIVFRPSGTVHDLEQSFLDLAGVEQKAASAAAHFRKMPIIGYVQARPSSPQSPGMHFQVSVLCSGRKVWMERRGVEELQILGGWHGSAARVL
ncbi:unnamed protein product [Symbiodinium sp. KB8]|nr:unnamed protein product [Symbiodinium sp. KB8]